jgi:hypothetical protein
MAEDNDTPAQKTEGGLGIWGLVITGLLALLGTMVSGVVKGYWDSRQAQDNFQSTLILKALGPTDPKARLTSLKFLITANLIRDPSVVDGINKVVAEGVQSVPRFAPENSVAPEPELGGVLNVPSMKALLTAVPRGAKLALVGLRIHYGDVIGGIGPLFAPIGPGLNLGGEIFGGPLEGGSGGEEAVLEKDGYIVTGINIVRGAYFGRDEVAQLQIIWHRLTSRGIDPRDQKVSKILGSGRFVTSRQEENLLAAPGNYISDFSPTISSHTDGTVFLNDIGIRQDPLPEP